MGFASLNASYKPRCKRRHEETCATSRNEHTLSQKKSRPKAAHLIVMDQAAIKAGVDFRRQAMRPKPAKPRISIAQVEGSGTAATADGSATPWKARSEKGAAV
jgi:hypothetical protein